jgi:hypothetical protein
LTLITVRLRLDRVRGIRSESVCWYQLLVRCTGDIALTLLSVKMMH